MDSIFTTKQVVKVVSQIYMRDLASSWESYSAGSTLGCWVGSGLSVFGSFNDCISLSTVTTYLLLFSHSVMSDSLQPLGLKHARIPCHSPCPGACSSLCPLSWWCHPTISSSVIPFSSCLQSLPASGSFQMTVLCIRLSKYWSFSFNISPSNEYSGLISFRMNCLESPSCPRDLQESYATPLFKSINSCAFSPLHGPILSFIHGYWKNRSFD